MLPENPMFLVRGDDGQEYGPVGLDELRDWVQENRAGLGTEMKRDEPNGTWQPWQNYPELIALLAEVSVTSPVAGLPSVALAPLGRRVLAFLLDLIASYVLFLPIILVLAFAFLPDWLIQSAVAASRVPYVPVEPPPQVETIFQSCYAFVLLVYFGVYLAVYGRTPGQALLRLRVIGPDGQKPSPLRALARTLALVFSIFVCFLPMTFAFFNPQRRALHDLIAATCVVEA
jgi:uncharacterized RDD family membrane protein YckC